MFVSDLDNYSPKDILLEVSLQVSTIKNTILVHLIIMKNLHKHLCDPVGWGPISRVGISTSVLAFSLPLSGSSGHKDGFQVVAPSLLATELVRVQEVGVIVEPLGAK